MPIQTGETMRTGSIVGVLPATAGLRADITAPAGVEVGDVPGGGVVVGWVLIADPSERGGARIDPVFLAAGRTWTPDQYRTAYGHGLGVQVRG
jgi:hypothetical protein